MNKRIQFDLEPLGGSEVEGVVECLGVEEDGEPILGTHRGPGLDVHMLAEILGLVVSVLQGRVEHCLNQSKVIFILEASFDQSQLTWGLITLQMP